MEFQKAALPFRGIIMTFLLVVLIIFLGVTYRYQSDTGSSIAQVTTVPTPTIPEPTEAQIVLPSVSRIRSNFNPDVSENTDTNVESFADMNENLLNLSAMQTAARVGDMVKVTISASSNGKSPLGYDALVQIDSGSGDKTYTIVEVKSLLTDFSVLKFIKDTHLTLTGVMKLSGKESAPWENIPVAEVTFKPQTAGTYTVQIVEEAGRESSKIMVKSSDEESEKINSGASAPISIDITE